MEANYGGTEIRQALQYALGMRTGGMPTAVFVLTDGEAYDITETVSVVENAVQCSQSHSLLRVFALGIGDGVSSAMCEGIARAGNGVCLFAVNTESILGKCARLFRAGRTPFIRNVKVDWGISGENLNSVTSSVNFSIPPSSSRTVRIRSLPVVQQVPTKLRDIHAGTRVNIFVILTVRRITVPESVVLQGELDDGGEVFEMKIPIQGVQLAEAKQGLPLIHTLAAWRLIQEHGEKRAPLPLPVSASTDDDIRKAVMVRLAEKYQLVCQYTSFVAINSDQDNGGPSNNQSGSSHRRRRESLNGGSGGRDFDNLLTHSNSGPGLGSTIINFLVSFFKNDMNESQNQTVPGAWTDSPLPSRDPSDDGSMDQEYESAETFSTLSSLDGSSEWSDWSVPEQGPEMTEEEAQRRRSPSPQFEQRTLAPEAERRRIPLLQNAALPHPPAPLSAQPEVVELVMLQSFDGSFPLHSSISRIVGSAAVDEVSNLQVDDKIWITALSIAFIEKHTENQELKVDLLTKAREFLERNAGNDFGRLMRRARELVT